MPPANNQGGFGNSPFDFEMAPPPMPSVNAHSGQGGNSFGLESFAQPPATAMTPPQAQAPQSDFTFDYQPFNPPASQNFNAPAPANAPAFGGYQTAGNTETQEEKSELDLEIEKYQREIEEKQKKMRSGNDAAGFPPPATQYQDTQEMQPYMGVNDNRYQSQSAPQLNPYDDLQDTGTDSMPPWQNAGVDNVEQSMPPWQNVGVDTAEQPMPPWQNAGVDTAEQLMPPWQNAGVDTVEQSMPPWQNAGVDTAEQSMAPWQNAGVDNAGQSTPWQNTGADAVGQSTPPWQNAGGETAGAASQSLPPWQTEANAAEQPPSPSSPWQGGAGDAFSDFEAELSGTGMFHNDAPEEYPTDSAMFFTTSLGNHRPKKPVKPPVNPAKMKAAQQQQQPKGFLPKLFNKNQ
jgi:hypothetical protein